MKVKTATIVLMAALCGWSPLIAAQAKKVELTILHTNDMHACFKPDKQGVGGLALLASVVKEIRSKNSHVLLVDCGDRIVKGDLFVHNSKGLAAYQALEPFHYDAYAIGNTDLSFGLEGMQEFRQNTEVPILSANITIPDGSLVADQPAIIKNFGGYRVAILGLIYVPGQDDALTQKLGTAIRFSDPERTITDYRTQHAAEFDLLVILSHLGWEADKALADKLSGPIVFLGAHSHTLAPAPYSPSDSVVVVQAGTYCKQVGELKLQLDSEAKNFEYQWQSIALEPTGRQPDEETRLLLVNLEQRYAPGMSDVIGEASDDFTSWNSLANLGTEALRFVGGAEIAFSDRGFVRDVIVKGVVTKEDIHKKSPYSNKVAVFQASGQELIDAMIHNLRGIAKGRLDFGGPTCIFEQADDGTVRSVSTGLDPKKMYKIASSDYILKNGDFFFGRMFEYQVLELTTIEAQIQYISQKKIITPDPARYLNCRGCTEPDRTVKF